LWHDFADTEPSANAISTMRDALIGANFAILPWIRSMLVLDEFCSDRVKAGLVRTPTELVVALMVATGKPADEAGVLWLMEGMGQRPLFPPNVSGWKPNGYWVNAGAMEWRARTAQNFFWRCMQNYWSESGAQNLVLGRGAITRAEVTANTKGEPNWSDAAFVDRILELAALRLSPETRQSIINYSIECSVWERVNALLLVLLAPELHLA
jgi:uncharacterized protein (DUF1800 family)